MSNRTLRITLLASEWKSSKGGLSTMNRELAKQLAKHPNVSVSFFVPKCCEEDKKEASGHNVKILEAKERPGYEPVDWLAYPPKDLAIDFVVGHGVVLGKQAQIIRDSHYCKWVQVVHTAPYELAMYKTYSGAISKGNEKQRTELKLCKMADLVIAVGPKLVEFYSAHLSSCGKNVYNFTPGIFTELFSLKLSSQSEKFRLLVFGRGDSEDFELKGYDIAAQAVAKLNDKTYYLTFVGAPSGSEDQVTEELLKQGLDRSQLIVEGYLEDREDLVTLLCASNLVVIPSRTEGFGLTALEALSAGLPFLVSQNSGFGEALKEISLGSTFIVDSEDPEKWSEAIKRVRQKGSETAIQECQELRRQYTERYSWKTQSNELLRIMLSSCNGDDQSKKEEMSESSQPRKQTLPQKGRTPPAARVAEPVAPLMQSTSLPERPTARETVESSSADAPGETRAPHIRDQRARPNEQCSSSTESTLEAKDLSVLGWNAKPESLSAVSQLIQKHRNVLNLSSDPDVYNLAVNDIISYLENNLLKHCVLVVNAEKVKVAREQGREVNYLRLLQTAERNVAEKIIITVCCPRSFSINDGSIVNCTIKEAFNDRSKVYVTWFVKGKLELTEDNFVMLLTSAIKNKELYPQRRSGAAQIPSFETDQSVYAQANAASGSSRDIDYNYSSAVSSHGAHPHCKTEGHSLKPPADSYNYKIFFPTGKTLLVDTRLRNGIISELPEDVQYWMPGFVVPFEIARDLTSQNSKNSNAELVILLEEEGCFVCQVDKKRGKEWEEKIVLALDESVVLQTRLKYGQISFEDKDVVIRYSNLRVPTDEVKRLEQNYRATPKADLFIISNSEGNSRLIVQVGLMRKMFTFINTVGKM